ncbi:caspase family protein [Methylorubrum sp. Q1]|uniref:caspase family protein n=1 Tax=Methylorubrum sp. Q1 TaxID=2562453 RepID=UPI00187D2D7D|nr:caspase family protein [Methylorubrum sp. Q1]
MIRGGKGARALVVGVEAYDLAEIPQLSGATADAIGACRWLTDIGVAPDAIHLHLSPASPPAPDDLAFQGTSIRFADATWRSVWRSLNALTQAKGDRLFIVMSGHGIMVPPQEPALLLQDYGVDNDFSANLGVSRFIDFFLSMNFPEQFLFCDACENYVASPTLRSRVRPRGPPDETVTPRADTGLAAAFSASPGQRAYEDQGRGLMMSRLLAALDPDRLLRLGDDDPVHQAVSYDWNTGELRLPLDRLMQDVIAPEVSEAAQRLKGAAQTPRATASGAVRCGPILTWSAERLADVTVDARPDRDRALLESVRLVTIAPTWNHVLSIPPVALPATLRLPEGVDVVAQARGRNPERPPEPPRLDASVNSSTVDLVFTILEPTRGRRARADYAELMSFNLRTVAPTGNPTYNAHRIYADERAGRLMERAKDLGLKFVRHEHGPDLLLQRQRRSILGDYEPAIWSASEEEGARAFAAEWAGLVAEINNELVVVAPPGTPAQDVLPTVRIEVPPTLPGALAESATLLLEAEGDDPVRLPLNGPMLLTLLPGAYRVSIDLPWGHWSRTSIVKVRGPGGGEPAVIELPNEIGRPPLRNGFFARRGDATVVWEFYDVVPGGLIQFAGFEIAALPRQRFAIEARAGRVEPFSNIGHPAWDAFFSAGRLDWLSREGLLELLHAKAPSEERKTETDLLRLAAAYALAMSPEGAAMLKFPKFRKPVAGALDVEVLRTAFQGGRPDLLLHLREGRRPLLRWGWDLMKVRAEDVPGLAEQSARQLPGSVWTALKL